MSDVIDSSATPHRRLYSTADELPGLQQGAMSVEWVDYNEGYDGEYNPDDKQDVELLRLDVNVLRNDGAIAGEPDCESETIRNGSFCTLTPKATAPWDLQALLGLVMDLVYAPSATMENPPQLSSLLGSISYIEPDWLRTGPPPHVLETQRLYRRLAA